MPNTGSPDKLLVVKCYVCLCQRLSFEFACRVSVGNHNLCPCKYLFWAPSGRLPHTVALTISVHWILSTKAILLHV